MSDMPGLEFDLGEMADTIRDTTERFARDKIAPIAAAIDEADRFPIELWPQMGELGLHGITVEEEWGGLGLGYLEHVVAQEEVARAFMDYLGLKDDEALKQLEKEWHAYIQEKLTLVTPRGKEAAATSA